MKYILPVMTISILVSGCSSPAKNWQPYVSSASIETRVDRSFELNKEIKTATGNPMIISVYTKGYMTYKPTAPIIAWRNAPITNLDTRYATKVDWQPAYYYPGDDGDYVLTSKSYYKGVIGIIANKDGTVPEKPVMRIDKKGSDKRRALKTYKKDLFTTEFMPLDSQSSYNYELIYSGKGGNVINITYREYVGNMVKDAFTQNLTYDISKSKIIQFKSTKMEVVSANNSGIQFKVLESR